MEHTKKKLTRLRLINWHYLTNETVTFGSSNLFSGENGAGKSTVLDAIQLILTTNTRRFNIAANSESNRTLKSYIRGKTGEEGNEYIRKGAVISYIALEVYEESKQRYFVIGAKFDSPDLESEVKKKWFCEEGTLDQLSFIIDNKPANDDKFTNNGRKVTFITQTSAAKDRFKVRLGHLESSFFDILPKSIAFKPMKDVKSFVSQFILPEKIIDINALRENINSLKDMQKIFEETKRQVESLEEIRTINSEISGISNNINIIEFLIAIADLESKKEIRFKKSQSIEFNEQKIKQIADENLNLERDIESLEERRSTILASLKTGENAQLISSVRSELSNKEKDAKISASQNDKLVEQINCIKTVQKSCSDMIDLSAKSIGKLADSQTVLSERNELIQSIENDIRKLENTVSENVYRLGSELQSVNDAVEKLSVEIKSLENNKITYNANVTMLQNAIKQEFDARGIKSSVSILADLLEINDKRWQNAVEGYLNTQRFYLIVEPAYYDIAVEVYNKHKNRIHTAAVINAAKLKLNQDVDVNSLAAVVESQNRYASAYISYVLGRVVRCDNVAELKQHSIAVTDSCMLYQGHSLRRIDPKIYALPYIGEYALQKQLEIKKAEYEQSLATKADLSESKEKNETMLRDIKACNFGIIKDTLAAPLNLLHLSEEISALKIKLNEAENDPNYIELLNESDELLKVISNKKKCKETNIEESAKASFEIEQLTIEIQTLSDEISELDNQMNQKSAGNEHTFSEAQKRYEEHKRSKPANTIYDNYQPRRQTLLNQKENKIKLLQDKQYKYKAGEFGIGLEMMSAYDEEYVRLSRHDLVKYEEKLRQMQDACEEEFRESFLAKMRENIENAVSLFKTLNRTLKTLYFGNDSYQFEYSSDKNKRRLYEMIMSEFNLGGFTLFSSEFEKDYHDEMEELFAKLTADYDNSAALLEYTDYRSYLDYDIRIISKDGRSQQFSKIFREKSGGETQTPYYVAIAASFLQVYSIGETIRIIMLDEAFDKMDEDRIEQMLNFFKIMDFQVILAAPTSRLELIGEQVDKIIMIYSDHSHNSFTEEYSYDEL